MRLGLMRAPAGWPWATAIIRAFERILALPHLTSTNDLIEYREEAHPHAPGPWNSAPSGTSADAHP